jgi:cation transport ATPase
MDASRSRTPASVCPGCGKEIDALRAGHVAILDGGFRYFCGAECKAAFVDVSSKREVLSAATAEPPVVASVVASGVREKEEEENREQGTGNREQGIAEGGEIAAAEAVVEEEREGAEGSPRSGGERAEAEPAEVEAAPFTLRSEAIAGEKKKASAGSSRVAAVAPGVGIAVGVLSAVVSLAGDAGAAMRLPLALGAAAIVATHALLRTREPSDSAPWVVVGPVLLAAVGAVMSVALHDPRAEAHAAYVGVAAAAALVIDVMLARARRDVVEARGRTAGALAVRVRVVRGEATAELDAAQVRPGEQVVVEAGEVIGVDGVVAAGEAEVAPWVDSPVVLTKREGDSVVAGATVVGGRLRVTTTFAGAERAWTKLAQSHVLRIDVAAPLVASARRVLERGAPVAALLASGATYANNASWPEVIVAASAGAYALAGIAAVAASALAHARGHVAAQRRGIVYKDAEAFDAAARADVAVVCSRGTILLGEPEIVVVEAVGAKAADLGDTARVLSLAAGAEMASNDAFAAAILRAARARSVRPETVRSALVHSGLGVTALAPSGDKVIVGSRAFLLKEKVSVAIADARASELEAQGRSVLLVALGGRLVGLLALQDGIRPGARAAVQRLHDARIEPVLLSGEARDTCETIARTLDIEHVRPEILPADRGAEVRALADGGRVVAAIGHPTSDDGALGAADVSVAMTAAGAAPGEWAVSLASDDVRDAALALTVPRACRERAKSATLVGAAAQGLTLLAIAFGAAPALLAPVVAVLATGVVLAVVREPTTIPTR